MALSLPRLRFLLALLVVPLLLFCLFYRLELQISLSSFSFHFISSNISLQNSQPENVEHTQVPQLMPFTRHIVAVGDLHGDMLNAERVLRFAGVVDDFGDWSGDVDFFVQTGDIIDR
jgi:hypothetical protein